MEKPVLKTVEDILKEKNLFFVAAYQRGYRWTSRDVKLLIDDICQYSIEESDKDVKERCPFYSLQSVVVKRKGDGCVEVVDGQQRLTTVLILLQTLHVIEHEDYLSLNDEARLLDKNVYSIQYETRAKSDIWLKEVTKAYLMDGNNSDGLELQKLKNKNPDYYHFVEVFLRSMKIFEGIKNGDYNNGKYNEKLDLPLFKKTLNKQVKFIWSDITDDDSAKEIDFFERINDTKIGLNNAELVKGVFLQESVFDKSKIYEKNQIAVEWDLLEKKLHKESFWCFICPESLKDCYETRIEYLLDLIKNKPVDAIKSKSEQAEKYRYFTFDKYYQDYLDSSDKSVFVNNSWKEIQDMNSLLEEWYNKRECYHYIGYLIEYGYQEENDRNRITIPYLKKKLEKLKKDKVHDELVKLVKLSIKDVKPEKLMYGKPELTQILFLFNIETEQQRNNAEARFSFSGYKNVKKWNQEHVASHIDYQAGKDERKQLAYDLFEYFTGVSKPLLKESVEENKAELEKYVDNVRLKYLENSEICQKIERLLLEDEIPESEIQSIFDSIMKYFESSEPFKIHTRKKEKIEEKDFIWNFVLLNEHTNKSYGNNIFPVKRKRILKDEFENGAYKMECYTPIGTRFVFEKAYSKKLTEMMKWGRSDAKCYWDEICEKLEKFLPDDFSLPVEFNADFKE